jgi:hypothetical protein
LRSAGATIRLATLLRDEAAKENAMMQRRSWAIGLWMTVAWGLLAGSASAASAGSADEFKLIRAVPTDAMMVVNTRDHAGRAFLNEQGKRVWAAVEKQGFERDIKRMLRGMMEEQGDAEQFDKQWQQMSDLAAGVNWASLTQREFAFAMKVAIPTGADFVFLFLPPADEVTKDFDGLTAILKNLAAMAPPEALALTSAGEGDAVVHKLTITGAMPPLSLTLARQKDVLLFGFGSTMPEQTLALLRGESDATAAIVSSERFGQALKRLPAPADKLFFVDIAKIMGQLRQGAQMAQAMNQPTTAEAGESGGNPLAFLTPALDAIDLWEYAASSEFTDGMKATGQSVVELREDAQSRALFKAFYGNPPLKDPLKYVPQDATGVNVSSGLDFQALYKAVTNFVEKEVPDGKDMLAQFKQSQVEMKFNVEEDLLSWLVGTYAHFTTLRKGAYTPEWVYMFGVRDEAKAQKMLDDLIGRLGSLPEGQSVTAEDANIEDAPNFKAVILPPFVAMLVGQPIIGVKDDYLFVGNGAKVVTLALQTGAGKGENFTKNERFASEGLPLGEHVTSYSFSDLTHFGDELSQIFAMAGMAQMFLPPEVMKNPAIMSGLSIANKVGKVVKTLDFYRSTCKVTQREGKTLLTKELTTYQEPPKPPTESAPAEGEKKADEPAKAPAGKKTKN